jgi:hypothetical protein
LSVGPRVAASQEFESAVEEICLNGDAWTFQPIRLPFFGYELDAPGCWKQPRISHAFIVDAISDPANDWETKHPVRRWPGAASPRRGFYLTGVRVRLFGESVEPTWKDGYTEGVGTSGVYLYNPEYWSAMVAEAERLNLTVLRSHRGMAIKRMFEIADEMGMMMIAESTISDGNHGGANGALANQRRAIRDMIVNLRNHPSVVIWSLANESPYNEAWAGEARLHDATRPYVATQTEPRNHPSPSLAATTGSYAMGLSGYEPGIYHRHDGDRAQKPMYVYEDNGATTSRRTRSDSRPCRNG